MTTIGPPHPHEQRKVEKLLLKLAKMRPEQQSLSPLGQALVQRERRRASHEVGLTSHEAISVTKRRLRVAEWTTLH